jgi:uncharacterized NAD(P)/FAD-binding protein YdhS
VGQRFDVGLLCVNEGEIYAVCDDGTRVQDTFVIGSGTASDICVHPVPDVRRRTPGAPSGAAGR